MATNKNATITDLPTITDLIKVCDKQGIDLTGKRNPNTSTNASLSEAIDKAKVPPNKHEGATAQMYQTGQSQMRFSH